MIFDEPRLTLTDKFKRMMITNRKSLEFAKWFSRRVITVTH